MQFFDRFGDQAHAFGFTAADINIAADRVFGRAEFRFGLAYHFNNFFGALSQNHSFGGQRNVVTAANQQLLPQLLFQFFDLPGKRRLGDVQNVGGAGNASFARNGQKIAQYSEFHAKISFVALLYCVAPCLSSMAKCAG